MFPSLLKTCAAAVAWSTAAVATCVGLHVLVIWASDPACAPHDVLIGIYAFLPCNDGRTALMVASSSQAPEKIRGRAPRFTALFDYSCEPPRIMEPLAREETWRVAAAANAPYGFLSTKNGELYTFDVRAQPPRLTALGSHGENCAEELECSSDGGQLFIAGQSAQLWDRRAKRSLWRRDDLPVMRATFSPGGERLFCGLATGDVVECDSATGNERRRLRYHRSSILSVSESPCGEYLASIDASGECVVTRLGTLETMWSRRFRPGALVRFSSAGDVLVIANPFEDCSLARANLQTGTLRRSTVGLSSLANDIRTENSESVFVVTGNSVVRWHPAMDEACLVMGSNDSIFRREVGFGQTP